MSTPDSAPAPAVHTDPYENYKLPIEGFKGTPEEIERQWFEQCYKGRGDSMWQLTWRAVIMGSVLGGLLSVTNIYIGLKAGWGFGVSITACILSYAIWSVFYAIGFARTPMTILENNCMQTAASAAGYSTGGTLISAFAAYILLTNQTIDVPLLMGIVFFLAILGVTMAVPMKRQMVNLEQLKFPSGVAAAETLKALHGSGSQGMRSAIALGVSALIAMTSKFWLEGLGLLNQAWEKYQLIEGVTWLNKKVVGAAWMGRTVMLSWDLMFIAAGAITGMRVCLSMMLGAVTCWMIFVPIGLNQGFITLTTTERLPVQLASIDLTTPPRVSQFAHYERSMAELKWEGIMTAEDRDALLAKSDNPWFQSAVERLYVRSQFRASVPLATRPADLKLEGDLGAALQYDAANQRLIMPGIVSAETYAKLQEASTSPEYQSALEALYARSRLPSREPLWAAAPLAKMPRHAEIPEVLGRRLSHDLENKLLLWRGPMSAEDKAAALAVSADPTYQQAVEALAVAADNRANAPAIPEALAGIVHYDAATATLIADGPIPEDLGKQWKKAVEDDPAADGAVTALIGASTASRASENYRDLVAWSLWAGTGCMVTSGLLAFALQWKSALRAFAGLGAMLGRKTIVHDRVQQEMDAIETPAWWFVVGQVVGLAGLIWLCGIAFAMPWWMTVVAVLLSFILAIVACRVTGETDTTPIGAMGKIMQLTFAAIAPNNMVANLMSANVTAGSAGSSAALLTDLKSGYLLGAHPRKQFLAQFSGIFVGTIVTVLIFSILVPNAEAIGNARFPAPAALVWKAVAEALGKGLSHLHPIKVWSLAIGGAVGILLPLLGMLFPKHAKYLPSAAGLGLAWTFPFYNAFMFFVGAVIGWMIEKRSPKTAADYTFTVASGLIAGESLMGAGLAVCEAGPAVIKRVLHM